MRILHLTWEFPPNRIGGLAEHVYSLSLALASKDNEVHVITPAYGDMKEYEVIDNIHVHRFYAENIPAEDFPSWVSQINTLFVNKAIDIMRDKEFDIIHGHDWIVANASIILKHLYRLPLVATIHATEHGRRGGIYDDRQQFIDFLEKRFAFEAWKVIACSHFMKEEISRVLNVPWEKIEVIHNGVFEPKDEEISIKREDYALPHEKIILYVGRHVYEKGLDVLVDAFNLLLKERDDVKLVIVGRGYYTDEVKNRVYSYGIAHKVAFTGFVDDNVRDSLYRLADVVVVPSRYEPFGIVALEGMKFKKVVVASDTGGLKEIIQHDKNGLLFFNANAHSLKDQLNYALRDDVKRRIEEEAYNTIKNHFNWYAIADKTLSFYNTIIQEYSNISWKPRKRVENEIKADS